jgi:hypothetical protein
MAIMVFSANLWEPDWKGIHFSGSELAVGQLGVFLRGCRVFLLGHLVLE